jgi:hypothetical protein
MSSTVLGYSDDAFVGIAYRLRLYTILRLYTVAQVVAGMLGDVFQRPSLDLNVRR